MGLALLVTTSGCAHKTVNTTPIPNSGPPNNDASQTGPPNGGAVQPEQPPVTTPGQPIPIDENSRYSKLWNGQGKEVRDKFNADTVYFDFDSATIKSSEDSKLQDVAAYFKGNTTDALTVEGNCDERGTEKYNLSLGDRRALAVREYLATLGVDPQRIHTVTFGASKPVDPGHDEAAWKKNRRGELVLLQPTTP